MSNPEYEKKLRDPRWQKKRPEVFEAAGWKCVDCGDTKEELHAHHLFYNRDKDPWDYLEREIICVCDTCHRIRHLDPEKLKAHAKRLCVNYKNIYVFSRLLRIIRIGRKPWYCDDEGERELWAFQAKIRNELREFEKSIKDRRDELITKIFKRYRENQSSKGLEPNLVISSNAQNVETWKVVG